MHVFNLPSLAENEEIPKPEHFLMQRALNTFEVIFSTPSPPYFTYIFI